jgi:hypothetical protein
MTPCSRSSCNPRATLAITLDLELIRPCYKPNEALL